MIDQRGRSWLTRYIVSPIGKVLVRLRVTASMITMLGLVVAIAGAVVLANGHPLTGAFLIALGGGIDGVDGTVARLTGTVSRRGAFLDTMSDRVGETAMFAGVAWFVADDPLLVLLAIISLGNSMLIPYARAKAEAEGLDGKGGIMGRAERIILFCALLAPVGWDWWGAEVMLWPMAILTGITAAQRFWKAWVGLG